LPVGRRGPGRVHPCWGFPVTALTRFAWFWWGCQEGRLIGLPSSFRWRSDAPFQVYTCQGLSYHDGANTAATHYGGSIMQQAHTAKQEALEAIQRLPDNADTEAIIYQLYVLENIRRGQQDATKGNTQSAEEVMKDIQSW